MTEDRFSNMKRADTPLDEEVRGLRLACGAVGVVFGPLIIGSSIVGLVLGLIASAYLIQAEGAKGLWAREIGAQVAAKIAWVKSEAEARNITGVLDTARAKARAVYDTAAHEVRMQGHHRTP